MGDTSKIDVTIDVYKLIEQNRLTFDETHDHILRRLLGLPILNEKPLIEGNFYLGEGVYIPWGTLFKREYKRKEYTAEVKDGGIWLNGRKFSTINQAVNAISDSNQNAWGFWKVKRPQDLKWFPLNDLRKLTAEDLADFD